MKIGESPLAQSIYKAIMKKTSYSKQIKAIAKESEIPEMTLRSWVSGRKIPSMALLEKFCKSQNISFVDLFKNAGE